MEYKKEHTSIKYIDFIIGEVRPTTFIDLLGNLYKLNISVSQHVERNTVL